MEIASLMIIRFDSISVVFVIKAEKASTGQLQREFKIGYNQASKLLAQLESIGVIGPEDGSKPRKVLINHEQLKAISITSMEYPQDADPLLPEAVELLIFKKDDYALVSSFDLRRNFKIDDGHAELLLEQMVALGILKENYSGSSFYRKAINCVQFKTKKLEFDETYYKRLHTRELGVQKIKQQIEDYEKMFSELTEIKPDINMDLISIKGAQKKLLLEKQSAFLMPDYKNSTVYKDSEKNIKNCNFIVIDVETTGLDQDIHEIIEFAAVRFVDFKPAEYMATLIKPSRKIPKRITEINGIDDDMVMTAPQIYLVAKSFTDFLNKENTIIAHNLSFDLRFLFANKIDLFDHKPKRKFFDTLAISRNRLEGKVHNNKLGTLLYHFDIYRPTAHRALDDCIATGFLFEKLLKLNLD